MKKKAQAAMEFLMTYGWAILVVLVVIGALAYFGVLNPQNLLPEKCTLPMGLYCRDHLINAGTPGSVSLKLENGIGHGIIITKINVSGKILTGCDDDDQTNGLYKDITGWHLANGASSSVTIQCDSVAEFKGKTKNDISLTYCDDTSTDNNDCTAFSHTLEGRLLARVESDDGGSEPGVCTPLTETQPCPKDQGVCFGSSQTCTAGGTWPGCTASDYGPDYEDLEETCDDIKDNDCDGYTDTADSDCEDIELGLILDMPFDIDSSTTAKDYSGYGNDGTVNGATWTSDGKVGGAYIFDGVDDYVDAGNDASLNPTTGITIGFWIYPASNPNCDANNNWRYVVNTEGWNKYHVIFEQAGNFGMTVKNAAGSDYRWWNPTAIPIGSWSYVVMTYDASTGKGRTYINSNLDKEETFIPSDIYQDTSKTYINYPSAACSDGGGNFNGFIDEVKIYDYALSADQILQNYIDGNAVCTPLTETQPCPKDQGVCFGSSQTCTAGGTWPGCTASDYGPDYEDLEETCDDIKDNDCDGYTDTADSDCFTTKWSGLGMHIFSTSDNTYPFELSPHFSDWVDELLANGFTQLRINVVDYAVPEAIAIDQAAIDIAVSKGAEVIWGAGAGYTGITAANWPAYRQGILDAAQWAQDNGVYEFQLGNEEEVHVDGTTMTGAQMIVNFKDVATEVQDIFTNGKISYSYGWGYEDDWIAAGKGDIDIIAFNNYIGGEGYYGSDGWKTTIDNLVNAFGVDGTYLTEFGPSYSDINDYSTDEAVQAAGTTEMIEYIKASGMKRAIYFCYYDDSRPFGVQNFGALKTDKTYRLLWEDSLLDSGD